MPELGLISETVPLPVLATHTPPGVATIADGLRSTWIRSTVRRPDVSSLQHAVVRGVRRPQRARCRPTAPSASRRCRPAPRPRRERRRRTRRRSRVRRRGAGQRASIAVAQDDRSDGGRDRNRSREGRERETATARRGRTDATAAPWRAAGPGGSPACGCAGAVAATSVRTGAVAATDGASSSDSSWRSIACSRSRSSLPGLQPELADEVARASRDRRSARRPAGRRGRARA